VAVSPDGAWAATAGNDQFVRIWNVAEGTLVRQIPGHQSHVYTVMFDRTGQFVVSGDLLGTVMEWEVGSGRLVKLFDASRLYIYSNDFRAHYGGVRSMAWSLDGSELACGGLHECTNAFAGENKPLALVFDYATGEFKRAHTADIRGVTWDLNYHPDGFIIGATGGQGGGALLFWAPDKEPESHRFGLPNTARGMDLHPDHKRIATTHYDRHLRITVLGA
jgi:WD40 repeat protein